MPVDLAPEFDCRGWFQVPVTQHPVIVVGASAGGLGPVSALLAGLPRDVPAAVVVVIHIAPYYSDLPLVLAGASSLPVVAAENGAALRPGTVYVCVPDQHVLLERTAMGGALRLTRGPKENRTRPAIDPLFRSAAVAFGSGVIAVVLSGALDDGTAGLWAVRDHGGLAVIQDPSDAAFPGMPSSALDEVGADYVVPARELGPLLYRLAIETAASPSTTA